MPDRPIGVFDSGLGGLTVLRAMIDLLPDERIVYFGDTGRFPYGPKPRDEVLKYSLQITDVLLGHDVKTLVVACNSAAAAALHVLDEELDIPVLGVIEPGLRAAINVTRTGRVGVIGTVGTIASGAYQEVAAAADHDIELTCAACPGFVEFVEAGDVDSDQVHVLAERLLAPVREAEVDTLVLGCTHYPFIRPLLERIIGDDIAVIDPAPAVARHTRFVLQQHRLIAPDGQEGALRCFTSGDPRQLEAFAARVLEAPCAAEAVQWHHNEILTNAPDIT